MNNVLIEYGIYLSYLLSRFISKVLGWVLTEQSPHCANLKKKRKNMFALGGSLPLYS